MDTKLLELLVCPVTKGPLDYNRERQELVSRSARLAYPVRDGIPVLLENEARTLTDAELEQHLFPFIVTCLSAFSSLPAWHLLACQTSLWQTLQAYPWWCAWPNVRSNRKPPEWSLPQTMSAFFTHA